MNRCYLRFPYLSVLGAALLLTLAGIARAEPADSFGQPASPEAQTLPRHFPDIADKGYMRFVNPPEVILNGVRLHISPGARIKDQRNMMLHMSQLKGRAFHVMYVRDAMQQVGDIWLLSEYEKSQPSPMQKREQLLRMDGYDPARDKINSLLPYHQQPKY